MNRQWGEPKDAWLSPMWVCIAFLAQVMHGSVMGRVRGRGCGRVRFIYWFTFERACYQPCQNLPRAKEGRGSGRTLTRAGGGNLRTWPEATGYTSLPQD